MKILVINGSNLNLLGVREPMLYGNRTYADLVRFIEASARDAGVEVKRRAEDKSQMKIVPPAEAAAAIIAALG